jgi:hypothetical protein
MKFEDEIVGDAPALPARTEIFIQLVHRADQSELTDGRGVDCIVEIGGPGTIAMSLKGS